MKVLFLIHRDPESLVIFVTGLLLIIEQRINPTWNTNVYYEYLYTDINNSFLPFISKRFYPVSLQIRVPTNIIESTYKIRKRKKGKNFSKSLSWPNWYRTQFKKNKGTNSLDRNIIRSFQRPSSDLFAPRGTKQFLCAHRRVIDTSGYVGRVALLAFERNFPVLRILVNDRSWLTYHCSRAIITFGRSQKRSRSTRRKGRGRGTRRSLLLESFRPFEHGIRSIGSLLNFREMESLEREGIYEEELWESASIPIIRTIT